MELLLFDTDLLIEKFGYEKRIKKSFLNFWDSLKELKQKKIKLNKNDILRLQSMYYSRFWCFKITDFGNNYIKCVHLL